MFASIFSRGLSVNKFACSQSEIVITNNVIRQCLFMKSFTKEKSLYAMISKNCGDTGFYNANMKCFRKMNGVDIIERNARTYCLISKNQNPKIKIHNNPVYEFMSLTEKKYNLVIIDNPDSINYTMINLPNFISSNVDSNTVISLTYPRYNNNCEELRKNTRDIIFKNRFDIMKKTEIIDEKKDTICDIYCIVRVPLL